MTPDAARLIEIYQAWKASVTQAADVEGLQPTFVLNVISASGAKVGNNNGVGNVWGLEEKNLIIWQLSNGWVNQADDLRVTNWAKNFVDYHHSINQASSLASEFLYMGDIGENQNPFLGMPLANVQRMRE
ncbi:hypothetical protein M7I_5802 [Glarea lozoyensis 74030]|nr:hypothetical protein M7I_5802 [Glarea lozoyensis 74030]